MSELADLTAAGIPNVLPGYILSRFGLEDHGLCETEYAQRHYAGACAASAVVAVQTHAAAVAAAADAAGVLNNTGAKAALQAPMQVLPLLAEKIMELANSDIRRGYFNWGQPGYDAYALSAKSNAWNLWVCLRIKHPQITYEETKALLTRDNEEDVRMAVLEKCMGFVFAKKNLPAGSNPSPETSVSGGTSTTFSVSADTLNQQKSDDSPNTNSAENLESKTT